MANNKNPNEKQPGETAPGKYHYNPGNMSGKTVKLAKRDPKRKTTATGYRATTGCLMSIHSL